MNKINLDDTIAAVSTPPGTSGIGIVRLSGVDALSIIEKLFVPVRKNKPLRSHAVHYGHIVFENETVDEVLVMVMKAPNSYTRQDVVEINCHGGICAVRAVLHAVFKCGARPAEPGEFTKRAFLNGRIDLSQAEAVMDIINAPTDLSHKTALHQLEGRLSKKIKTYRQALLTLAAHIEASIDYPEHDMDDMTSNETGETIQPLNMQLKALYKTADTGKIVREGIQTVIVGTPNVGKSSLLNYFVDEERAIVTDIPGTTRDSLHEFINLNGIPVKIVDTAGIRDTSDVIEKMGVTRSLQYAKEADLILLVIDGAKNLCQDDMDILHFVKEHNKKVLVLINKIDLPQVADLSAVYAYVPETFVISLSVKDDLGLDTLYEKINTLFFDGVVTMADDMVVINDRMKHHLWNAIQSLDAVLNTVASGMSIDFITIDLMDAYQHLGFVIGESVEEDIIDKIFADFCLGK